MPPRFGHYTGWLLTDHSRRMVKQLASSWQQTAGKQQDPSVTCSQPTSDDCSTAYSWLPAFTVSQAE